MPGKLLALPGKSAPAVFFRLFNTNHPSVFLFLLVYALLIKGSFFFFTYNYDYQFTGLLAEPLFSWLSSLSSGWQAVIHLFSVLMVYTQAIAFNQFLLVDRIIQVPNYMPALIFLTLSSLQPEAVHLSPINLAYLFVIPVFYYLFQLPYIQSEAVEMVFYGGMFIGIVSLLYFPSIYLLGTMLIAIVWLRGFHIRELLTPAFGFIMPYFLGGVYAAITDQLPAYAGQLQQLLPSVNIAFGRPGGGIVVGTIVLLLSITGFIRAYQAPNQNIMLYRRLLGTLLLFIISGIVYFFIVDTEQLLFGYLLLLPVSVFVSSLYDAERPSPYLRAIFWILVLLALFAQWVYYLDMQGTTPTEWLDSG